MKPNVRISDKQREAVVQILNIVIADEYVLYTKTRSYHEDERRPSRTAM